MELREYQVLIEALAYLGLLFVGLRIFGDGFQNLFEDWIKKLLRSLSHNKLNSLGIGLVVTLLVQSSSVATLSAMGLTNAGLMSFGQLVSFNLGSYLSATFISWFFASYALLNASLLVGLGLLVWAVFRHEKSVELGRVFFGMGLVLFGLAQLSLFGQDLVENTQTLVLEQNIYVSFFVSIALSFFFRSTLLVVLFALGLCVSSFLPLHSGVMWVVGANLGASMANVWEGFRLNRKPRQAVFLLFFAKFVLSLIVLLSNSEIVLWVENTLSGWSVPYLLTFAYSAFNFLILVLVLPLSTLLESFVSRVKEPQRLTIVGGVGTLAPTLAIEQGWQELAKLAAMTETIMTLTRDLMRFSQLKEEELKRIRKYEKITNNIQAEILEFLRVVTRARLSGGQAEAIRSISSMSDELELISDHCLRLVEMRLSSEWQQNQELASLFDVVVRDYEKVFARLTNENEPLVLRGRESLVDLMKVDGALAAKYHIASIHNSVKNLSS